MMTAHGRPGIWQWVDGNSDGAAECYYFDSNGYMLESTVTPDGYMVNENGAWTVDGTVQTKQVQSGKQSGSDGWHYETAAGNIMKTAASSGMHGSTPAETGIIFPGTEIGYRADLCVRRPVLSQFRREPEDGFL